MRTFAEIAKEIYSTWTKISPYARPYLEAMSEIHSSDKHASYYYDDAKSVVLYFLSNASTWRGEDARRIKAELKAMVA